MPHNSLINGASHGISSAQTIINGTGYKINSGKTLIDGTGHNIAFETPLEWHWNDVLIKPASFIVVDIGFRSNAGALPHEYFKISIGWDAVDNWYVNYIYNVGAPIYSSNFYDHKKGGWLNPVAQDIRFFSAPTGDLLAYLWANATPIYN